jgi:hypothetical protein
MPAPATRPALADEARSAHNWHRFQALIAECEGDQETAAIHNRHADREALIVDVADGGRARALGWL